MTGMWCGILPLLCSSLPQSLELCLDHSRCSISGCSVFIQWVHWTISFYRRGSWELWKWTLSLHRYLNQELCDPGVSFSVFKFLSHLSHVCLIKRGHSSLLSIYWVYIFNTMSNFFKSMDFLTCISPNLSLFSLSLSFAYLTSHAFL